MAKFDKKTTVSNTREKNVVQRVSDKIFVPTRGSDDEQMRAYPLWNGCAAQAREPQALYIFLRTPVFCFARSHTYLILSHVTRGSRPTTRTPRAPKMSSVTTRLLRRTIAGKLGHHWFRAPADVLQRCHFSMPFKETQGFDASIVRPQIPPALLPSR
jgi:hypothetical protein